MNALNPITTDGAELIAKTLTEREAQDWELLVSPGHVLSKRVKTIGWFGLPVAVVTGLFGVTTLFGALGGSSFGVRPPEWLSSALIGNPSTWTDLGNGVRASYELAWLTDLPDNGSLNEDGWASLVKAISTDVTAHGFDAASWSAAAELGTKPQITRPAKALTEHVGRLATGIVAVPEDGSVALIVGRIDGALSLAAIAGYGGQCATVTGPAIEGCDTLTPSEIEPFIQALKPAAQE